MAKPLKAPKLPDPPEPASKERKHDKALEDTFPASDPVPLKPPKREPAPATSNDDKRRLTPQVRIDDEAMPPEKPM